MVEYRHFRLQADGKLVQKGGVTLSLDRKDGNFLIGFSNCSSNDMFCKKTAREVSLNRLNTSPISIGLDAVKLYLGGNLFNYFGGVTSTVAKELLEKLTIEEISSDVLFDMMLKALSAPESDVK